LEQDDSGFSGITQLGDEYVRMLLSEDDSFSCVPYHGTVLRVNLPVFSVSEAITMMS